MPSSAACGKFRRPHSKLYVPPSAIKAVKILINYATPNFASSRRTSTATGYAVGGFDKVLEYSPEDLDEDFRRRNRQILKIQKGGGYWVWKPYVIKKTLEWMDEGDFLFYADASAIFTGPVGPLIEVMRQKNQDVLPISLRHEYKSLWEVIRMRNQDLPPYEARCWGESVGERERCWTKRDTFTLMGCDAAQYLDTKQINAARHLWRKTGFSMNLVNEWLSYAQDERIITDMPNQLGKENYPEFRAHRHDQSIWSLLCKKHRLQVHLVGSSFVFNCKGPKRHKGYGLSFVLMYPMKFRPNILILREILVRCLRIWLQRGLKFLRPAIWRCAKLRRCLNLKNS